MDPAYASSPSVARSLPFDIENGMRRNPESARGCTTLLIYLSRPTPIREQIQAQKWLIHTSEGKGSGPNPWGEKPPERQKATARDNELHTRALPLQATDNLR